MKHTSTFKIYAGAEEFNNPSNLVDGILMDLSELILHLWQGLDAEWTLYTDNFYTSIALANLSLRERLIW